MNKDFEIYSDEIANIPDEDRARLNGYLRGREEADLLQRARILKTNKNKKLMTIPKTRKKKS